MASVQAELIAEATQIISEAHGWFVHVLPRDTPDACFVAMGRESTEHWRISVRTGLYKATDPNSSENNVRMPETTKEPENQIFVTMGDGIVS